MKLLINGDRIAAAVADSYTGPMPWVFSPPGFDITRIDEYRHNQGTVAIPELTIHDHIAAKEAEIRQAAQERFAEQVTMGDGSTWRGGEGSAQSIKNAVDMAEYAGLTEITVRDSLRQPHTKTLDEARQIALHIGLDYQTKFQQEEDALLALSNIDPTADDAATQVAGISLPTV